MRQYGLKINAFKYVFGLSARKFLGFIVNENGVEIDPKIIHSEGTSSYFLERLAKVVGQGELFEKIYL